MKRLFETWRQYRDPQDGVLEEGLMDPINQKIRKAMKQKLAKSLPAIGRSLPQISEETETSDPQVRMDDDASQQKVLNALDLLKQKAPDHYNFAQYWLKEIVSGSRTGVDVVNRSFVLAPPSVERQSLDWVASIIYHEAVHVWQYETGEDGDYEKIDIETPANWRQIELLKKMGSPAYLISHLEQIIQQGDHSDLNGDGVYDWEDWKLRNWEEE